MANPEISRAVEELRACFPDAEIVASDTSDSGANVTIDPVELGPVYVQRDTWLRFAIGFQYPYSDIYPLFVRPDLARVDGNGHGTGITLGSFNGEPAMQLSRRNNRLNPAVDTAALKVVKVVKWLQEQ